MTTTLGDVSRKVVIDLASRRTLLGQLKASKALLDAQASTDKAEQLRLLTERDQQAVLASMKRLDARIGRAGMVEFVEGALVKAREEDAEGLW